MKRFINILLIGLFIFVFGIFLPDDLLACEIDFKIITNKQKIYKIDAVFITKITVTLTHRVCQIGIKNTLIKTEGLKILGATKWKQISTMVWERKLKIKVTGTKKGELLINAIRTCDKEGGFGSMILKSKPLKK